MSLDARTDVPEPGTSLRCRLTVVMMTHDRRAECLRTLERLVELPDAPAVVVVDNASRDGTPLLVRRRFPQVGLITLRRNAGVAARNLAVQEVDTPFVAFNDDDSWWAAGSLRRAVELFDRHPGLGALAARVLVEPAGRDDPVNQAMATSPLVGDPTLPGTPVLGFLACAAVVRRQAFLEVGGFEERFHIGGEEQLLATDLAARGWAVRHVPELAVHHQASAARKPAWRRRQQLRNDLWFLWLRRPAHTALRQSRRLIGAAPSSVSIPALLRAAGGLPWVLRRRRPVPGWLEAGLARLDPRPG